VFFGAPTVAKIGACYFLRTDAENLRGIKGARMIPAFMEIICASPALATLNGFPRAKKCAPQGAS
jgi:hypothetical protein